MKKDLYNTSKTNALRLSTPIRLNIHCRGEPETISIYHKRYFSAIENPLVEVVVPVLNEERILKANIETLHHFLRTQPGLNFRITIADNGSTDKTQAITNDLANSHAAIRVVRLDKKGPGAHRNKFGWKARRIFCPTWISIYQPQSINSIY